MCRMRLTLLSLVLLSLLFIVECRSGGKKNKKSNKSPSTENDRIAAIIQQITHGDTFLKLTDDNFTNFIVDRPRSYTAILILSTRSKEFKCSICLRALDNFELIAGYYHSQYDFIAEPIEKRVVFFTLDVDDARDTYIDLKIESIPRFFVLPPRNISSPKLKMGDFEISPHDTAEGASNVLSEVFRLSGIKISPSVDVEAVLLCTCFVAILLAYFAAVSAVDLKKALLSYQNSRIWLIVSLIFFSVGVSGSIFCVIRSAPLFGYSKSGLEIFADASGREQYLLEGLIIALWTVGCGAAVVTMFAATKIRFSIISHALVLFSMSMFIVFLLQIWSAYTEKTRWYNLRDTLPEVVWAWLKSSVKKTSGLPKRLLRLSEYVLFEFKDWQGFKKKANILVIDYLQRVLKSFRQVSK